MRLASALLTGAAVARSALAQAPGSIGDGGDTLVSAMMMFLGNDEKVYIMDKVEGNAKTINGHPGWASVWNIKDHTAQLMDFKSNAFCSSGMHLPNSSFTTFGGNNAVRQGGQLGSQNDGNIATYDDTYKDFDGGKAIRVVKPCTGDASGWGIECQWFDDANVLAMNKRRWYSTAEPLGDGTIVLIGGFQTGGYIARSYPNRNPDDGAENSYEFFPDNGRGATPMPFMRKTSGLNSYAHAFLMPSGQMLVQANYSTIMWDPDTGAETNLPDMPGQVVRVYPASGAVAMLPLTPANNYTPTVLFCGGQDMKDEEWGDFSNPAIDTWDRPASKDCQRITPEPQDKSTPQYVKDDDLLEGRTMGQFIILPTGQLMIVNGGVNGTAGYADKTGTTPAGQMPFGMSLASGPVGTPALYDPNAPKGQRWSNKGLGSSKIARLYHSSALLLPDGSVMIAGSNPNVDVNLAVPYPTTYKAEIFYPLYWGQNRPEPQGLPLTLTYGGDAFDIKVSKGFNGDVNAAAASATVVLIRPGWTTHAMNMGQRFLQLNNTYTVNDDGSFVLHTAQHPPNANLITPGPLLIFVVVNGVPSQGQFVTLGSGKVEKQPILAVAALPASQNSTKALSVSQSPTGNNPAATGLANTDNAASPKKSSSTGILVGGIIAGVAAVALVGAIAGVCVARRKRAARRAAMPVPGYNAGGAGGAGAYAAGGYGAVGTYPPPQAPYSHGAFMASDGGDSEAPFMRESVRDSVHSSTPTLLGTPRFRDNDLDSASSLRGMKPAQTHA